jgi:hypothetical protein
MCLNKIRAAAFSRLFSYHLELRSFWVNGDITRVSFLSWLVGIAYMVHAISIYIHTSEKKTERERWN